MDELLAAWEAWDRHPKGELEANRLADAIADAIDHSHLNVDAATLRRGIKARLRQGADVAEAIRDEWMLWS